MEKYIELSNGVLIPPIGLGTWQIPDGEVAYNSVLEALKLGYRHIDTAYVYGNEKSVGQAIKDSGVPREEIFVTTKCPANIKSYEGAMKHFKESLKNLGLSYIDLYLIHAPWPWEEIGKDCSIGNIEVWKAFIDIYKKGKVRSIGVSNFKPSDITNIYNATSFYPMVNQILFFISNTQKETYDFCKKNNIVIEAYSPLATGRILENEELKKIANKYNTTIAKICLAYCLQKDVVILPKSTHPQRIKENLDIDVTLSNEDMAYLDSLEDLTFKKEGRY